MSTEWVARKAQVVLLGDGVESIEQIMERQEEVIVLRGNAKRLFAGHVAVGLGHGNAFLFWNKAAVIVGRRCGTFIKDDVNYLGCAGDRVWHRWQERN
jgi:hypothetical protein